MDCVRVEVRAFYNKLVLHEIRVVIMVSADFLAVCDGM